ncbi:hypothetical protein LCGC14_1017670 [marine sediment metagenome]|uniref:Uncharacterized protein n=1 Tax=marine sediment metagenome TaxID=412755 RepID=A0A0F9MYD3_9ZZZZ
MASDTESERLLNALLSNLTYLDQFIRGIADHISTQITFDTGAIADAAYNAELYLIDSIDAQLQRVESTTIDALNLIADISVEWIDAIGASGIAALSAVETIANTGIDAIYAIQVTAETHISDLLSAGEEILLFQVNSATQALEVALEALLVPVETSANAFFVMARDTPNAINFLNATLLNVLTDLPAANKIAIADPIVEALDRSAVAFSGTFEGTPQELLREALLIIADSTPQPSPTQAARVAATLTPQGPSSQLPVMGGAEGVTLSAAKSIANILATAITTALSVLGVAGAQAAPAIRAVSQQAESSWQNAIPDPATLAIALKRKVIQSEEYRDKMGALGFGPQATESYLQNAEQEIGIIDAIALWHRGFIDREGVVDLLERGGSSELSANLLVELGNVLPGVQDLVRMAVREVYSPEIATEFGLFEEFPPQFAEEAAKQGLSEETAQQFWGAHWDLPSPNMGFEMFHRRIINEDTLHLLMRALDIMPFWRDKLIALAYNPLTRVDVRRMHALDVLDDEGVTNAYLDLGYSPENATRMTEFTIRYNAETSTLGSERQRELTTAQLLRLFRDGLTSEVETVSNLVGLGYSGDDAEILVTREFIQLELDEREDEKRAIIEMVKAGNLDIVQAQVELAKLNFSQAEIDIILNRLEREMAVKSKAPSEEKLVTMYKKRILSREELRESLSFFGYPDFWVSRLMRLYTGDA